ncbi:hypothetical protein B0H12DRAFT_1114660 [Mycena haematopus]|nr:hypothetical protein B0H12DRAFT_1114660 [Mycena haematopus]
MSPCLCFGAHLAIKLVPPFYCAAFWVQDPRSHIKVYFASAILCRPCGPPTEFSVTIGPGRTSRYIYCHPRAFSAPAFHSSHPLSSHTV